MREIAAAQSPAGLTATKLAEATACQAGHKPGRSACKLCPTRHISANNTLDMERPAGRKQDD